MKNAKFISTSKADMRKTGQTSAQPTDLQADRTDWPGVRSMTDADVEAAICSDRDEDGMRVDWNEARIVRPDRKRTMTIRLDGDVLAFFRDMGRGYRTTINAVLRSFTDHVKG